MNDLTANTPSENLNLFLDGELDPSMESQLFSELAINDELRTEMRELLAIRESVQNDIEAFTPPISAAGIVFNRLGFTPPQIVNLPVPGAFRGGIFGNLTKNLWGPAVAAVIAALFTALILINIYENKLTEFKKEIPEMISKESIRIIQKQKPLLASAAEPLSIEPGKVKGKNIPKIINNSAIDENVAENAVATTSMDNNGNNTVQIAQNNNEVHTILSLSEFRQQAENIKLQPGITSISQVEPMDYKTLINIRKQPGRKYSLVARGITGKSYPETGLPVPSYPFFSNMAAGAYYAHSDNLRIGLEAGEEPFGQIFNNKERNMQYQYIQNPMLFWATLGIQGLLSYRIPLIGGQPFAEIMVGGTELGPISKAMVGLQYYSSETGLGLVLAAEGTLLMYENQNQWYYTKKIGLTYGMSFNF